MLVGRPGGAVAAARAPAVRPRRGRRRRAAPQPRRLPARGDPGRAGRAGRGGGPPLMARILLVDDRPQNLLALEAILEPLGHTLVKAGSGDQALRCLLDDDFAVILLDVQMPGMDGFETASLIRQRKSTEHIPIIFVTAFGDENHASRGYSLGAVDYIQTPVVPEVLKTKVAVFVELYRKTEQVRRQAQWLQQRASQLHKLTAASLAINSALSIEKMLRIITDTAREIVGANRASTAMIRDGK